MELDDLKSAWATLERSLAINERLLRETMLRKVRFWQVPYVVVRALEVLVFGAMLIAAVAVLARHASEPRYLAIGGGFAIYLAGLTAMCAHQLVAMAQLDYGGPVTALQRAIAHLKRSEVRAFIWALLGGVVFWLPGLLIGVEAVTGIDALARVDLAYLVSNIVVGLVVLAGGFALATKYASHSRVVDALSGRGLRRMEGHLAELAKFQREP
jgi:hypothetical protein